MKRCPRVALVPLLCVFPWALGACADKAPGGDECLVPPCPTDGARPDGGGLDAPFDAVRDLAPADYGVDRGEEPDVTLDADAGTGDDATTDTARDALPDADAAADTGGEPDTGPPDRDEDGVPDDLDACPDDPTDWVDTDGDHVCDASDDFPDDIDEWLDTDGDGTGDNADTDDDGDTLSDEEEVTYGADCAVSNPLMADTDSDGVRDDQDPYPRDPFPEFILRRNDAGSIDLYLSNRDGTFQDPVTIGDPIDHDGTPLTYDIFAIGDFNGDGEIDFTAHSSIFDGGSARQFYFFWRDTKADEFTQEYIGDTEEVVAGIVTDARADFTFDLVHLGLVRPGYIDSGEVVVYLNNYAGGTPTCVWGDSAADGCFFVRLPAIDVTATVGGQWVARLASEAVNLNPGTDSYPDLSLITYSSGGNAATTVYTMFGTDSGGFEAPVSRFVHNASYNQAPANTVLFADFDGDDIGDVMLGFDDGAAGEAWTYFGVGDGTFGTTPVVALDLNPTDAAETVPNYETLGRTGSGRSFDFDFDGAYDLIVGYNHVAYTQPGQTRLYAGNGDGTFGPTYQVIGPDSTFAHSFAIPQRLCPTFEVAAPADE